MATEGTKFQVNFKLADGTLINVYASNSTELEAQLTTIQDTSALIGSVSAALGNASNVRYAVQALGATPINPLDDRVNPPAAPAALAVHNRGQVRHPRPLTVLVLQPIMCILCWYCRTMYSSWQRITGFFDHRMTTILDVECFIF